jgi:hypothetical protein
MITTKNIPTSTGTQKIIQPGLSTCKINSLSLEPVPYKEGAYNLSLNLETMPMGEDFEGFLVNKDDTTGPRYEGQVARVRFSEWAFSDGVTKSGISVSRDLEILKAVQTICRETGSTEWLDKNDNLHDTIEDFVIAFNSDKPFKDKYITFCIAGKEYNNKQGYVNFDLFLPRAGKGQVSLQNADTDNGKLMPFDSDVHIKRIKTNPVDSFSPKNDDDFSVVAASSKVGSDFDL